MVFEQCPFFSKCSDENLAATEDANCQSGENHGSREEGDGSEKQTDSGSPSTTSIAEKTRGLPHGLKIPTEDPCQSIAPPALELV